MNPFRARQTLILSGALVFVWYVGVTAFLWRYHDFVFGVPFGLASLCTFGALLNLYRRRSDIKAQVWFKVPDERLSPVISYCLQHRIAFEYQGEDKRIGFIDESDLVRVKLGA